MDRFQDATRFLLDQARANVKQVEPGILDSFMDELVRARHVVIFGRGRSGNISRAFAIRLGHLGFRSFFVGETSTPPVSEDDVVLLVSGSGQTFSVVLTAKIAHDLGAKVLTVTSEPTSELAEHADLVVPLATQGGEHAAELAPLGTVFEATAHLFFDGVVAELMERLGENEDSMAQRHATLE